VVRNFQIQIHISLKKGVADPQGATIKHALESLGYQGVEKVRMGKYLEMEMQAEDPREVEKQLKDMCQKLLVNPVIEKYTYQIRTS